MIIRGNLKLKEESIPVLLCPLPISHNELTRELTPGFTVRSQYLTS
jgi:hypothetical protein